MEQSVSWSIYGPRKVRRQRNIGDGDGTATTTTGVGLEAKFRLDRLFTGTPGVGMRSNLSVYTSCVNSMPGPHIRLEQQSKATGNIGADYRLRGVPLTLGGNLIRVPGYTTRLDVGQTTSASTKQVWEVFALWTI